MSSDAGSVQSRQIERFFSTELGQVELEEILRRIDENLAFRSILREQAGQVEASAAAGAPPPLPDSPDLAWRLHEIRQRQAPLFVVTGRDWPNQFRRLLNLPIRLFGHKQAYFNRETLDVLDVMAAQLQALRKYAAFAAKLGQEVEQLRREVQELKERVKAMPETRPIQADADALVQGGPEWRPPTPGA